MGEGSILYIYSENAIQNILEFNPDSKFIVMLRNPIDQAYSFYLQLRHSEYEKEKDFIGVEDDGKTEFEVVNQAKVHRNAFLKFIFMLVTENRFLYKLAVNTVRTLGISANTVNRFHKGKRAPKVPLTPETRKAMAEDLKDQVEILSDILGKDLSGDWADFKSAK